MTDTRLKIAVFVDFDNIEIGVKTTLNQPFDIAAVLDAIKERGEVVTKVAYGDWKRAGDYGRFLSQHAIRMVQRTLTPGGDKNGADINLALDALEMAFTHDHINAFVIVGGDSDFITLVEKLKQYDKKVFVVGGRRFTSLVMQKNCHEFIAYENLVNVRRPSAAGRRIDEAPSGPADVAKAVPLVRRALKVLTDREVAPQLGLLKSTLLQLDSTFSERDYGVSTFRDFIEKIARTGLLTLRHAGRSLLVDLADAAPASDGAVIGGPPSLPETPAEAAPSEPAPRTVNPEQARQGVERARELLQRASQPPRWPMYARQLKQYLRGVDETFDERTWGFATLVDFLRAAQREGVLRLERNRGGGLRVLPGADLARSSAAAGATSEPQVHDTIWEQPADTVVAPAPDADSQIHAPGEALDPTDGDVIQVMPAVAASAEDTPVATAHPVPSTRSRRPRRTPGAKPAPRRPSGVKTPGSRKRRGQA